MRCVEAQVKIAKGAVVDAVVVVVVVGVVDVVGIVQVAGTVQVGVGETNRTIFLRWLLLLLLHMGVVSACGVLVVTNGTGGVGIHILESHGVDHGEGSVPFPRWQTHRVLVNQTQHT